MTSPFVTFATRWGIGRSRGRVVTIPSTVRWLRIIRGAGVIAHRRHGWWTTHAVIFIFTGPRGQGGTSIVPEFARGSQWTWWSEFTIVSTWWGWYPNGFWAVPSIARRLAIISLWWAIIIPDAGMFTRDRVRRWAAIDVAVPFASTAADEGASQICSKK